MKILIQGINFSPELTGIGKFTGEMVTYLVNQGHQVRVVTAPPYYPQWKILPGFSNWRYQKQTSSNQVVYRCPVWVPSNPTGFKRLAHLTSFAISCLPIMLLQIYWKPDVVFNVAPTIFSAPVGLIIARLSGALAWLHIQDFELEAANSLGILNLHKGIITFTLLIESVLIKRFDCVSTISDKMQHHLYQKGVPQERTYLFSNWVDTDLINPLDGTNLLRFQLGVSDEEVLVLYSGNMGRKQGLEILIQAAEILATRKDILFVLCGDGSARNTLELRAENLPNMKFIPLQPFERLNLLLNAADIHILTQRTDAADLVMPSKLTGMLASGKPVIATALANTEIGKIVSKVGLITPPDDPKALAESIYKLAVDKEKRTSLGISGRKYAIAYWDKKKVLDSFARDLETFVKRKGKLCKTP
jgi:colanic acid biosynthesis glycosyl transferase WcaI